VCRSFRSPQKLFRTAARSNQESVSCIYDSFQNLLWLEIEHQNWWNQNVYFVSLFFNSPSFINSMQNTKFCLLPQIVGTMLNTTSELLMVRHTVLKALKVQNTAQILTVNTLICCGSHFVMPEGSLNFPFLQKCRFINCTVWISVPVVH